MMTDWNFRHPEAVWLLVAALLLLSIWTALRRRRFVPISTGALLSAGLYGASRVRRLPVVLTAAAFGALVLALMDRVTPQAQEQVQSHGVDIALVLDLSSSMEEMMGTTTGVPMRVTRLEVTKRAIADFIARRAPGDRIGLIVFSDNAYVIAPLTFDHGYLQRYVAMIDLALLRGEGMTAIGEGLATAHALLARQSSAERSRAIVLFTDGEYNYGRDPIEALRVAHDAGARVHLIGVDLAADIKTKPDVVQLIRTVERRGGRYFAADTAGQLTAASRAIDALEPGILVSSRSVRNVPAFEPFAAAAVVLILAALALRCIPFFVDLT
jgi:Ca-activated chloride channel family protein